MNSAIYFHPEAYTISGPKLMGRNAAGESFLRGFLLHAKAREFWAQVQNAEHASVFSESVRRAGRNEPVKIVDQTNLGGLAQVGTAYFPGPGIGQYAWHRAPYGHAKWSLCGITHTTSSMRAMDAIGDLLSAPVQRWDAVICTSAAVKDNVVRILDAQAAYLADRLNATKWVLPQLPVIPLGIHAKDFEFTERQKGEARLRVGAAENTLVVLFMGRLSFHAKAHPLAMYQALEKAARALPQGLEVVLVECGWYANDAIARAYSEAARLACPTVRVVTLDGRKAEDRQTAWASADVFCSLSDNIQETFGIVPIEAMAAGLPVVVSDWDGYRDTVRDGIDGFRIPTLMPMAGFGRDLAMRHAFEIDSYDMYCGHTCSFIAVDVDMTAKAFERLFTSPQMRRQMGDAGRERARTSYDWAKVIPQYESLWGQLADIRASYGRNVTQLAHPWPTRMDPFHAFAIYPTQRFEPQTKLKLGDDEAWRYMERVGAYRKLLMVNFAKAVLPSEAEVRCVIETAAQGPQPAIELVRAISQERQAFVLRALVWLAKLGVLKQCDGNGSE